MKRGLQIEAFAAKFYEGEMLNEHTGLKVPESGLVVCKDHPFIGASLDRVIQCECHGRGLLEIKCAVTCAPTVPTHETH